jgi:hypothetical protein
VKRRQRHGDSQNLDSLLDTMANVVGVLVVLMAVTQMTVNDAMKRIRVWESDEALDLRDQRRETESKLAMIGPASLLGTLDTSRLREHIKRLRSDPVAARPAEPTRVAAALARDKLRVRRLESELDEKNEQLSKLRIHLAEYEALPEPDAVELRLPDPRPPPLGAESVAVLCRYGRVFDPNLAQLEKDFFEGAQRARGLGSYFQSHDVGNRHLRWQVAETPAGQIAQLDWRQPNAGETESQLRAPNSELRKALDRYDPDHHFIRFFVWADSFEVYLTSRRIAEKAGFSIGWEAYDTGESLRFARSARGPPTPVD